MTDKSYKLLSIFDDLIEYFFLVIVIINCNSLFVNSVEHGGQYSITCILGFAAAVVILAYYLFVYKELRKEIRKFLRTMICLIAVCLLYLAINVFILHYTRIIKEFILLFICFLPIVSMIFLCQRKVGRTYELLFKYSNIICGCALVNLVFYVAFLSNPDLARCDVFYSKWSGLGRLWYVYSFLDIVNVDLVSTTKLFGYTILRNHFIFPEPLMYCIPLFSALYTELFVRDKENIRLFRIILLSVTICSSFSTLGIMLLVFTWGVKCLQVLSPELRKKLIVPIAVVVIVAVVALFIEKVGRQSMSAGSSIGIHIDDYRLSIKAFLHSPIYGTGFNNEEYIKSLMSQDRHYYNSGLSNSIAVILAEGGMLFGSVCMLPFAVGLLQFRDKRYNKASFWMLGMLALYTITIFHFKLFMLMIFAFGYSFVTIGFDKHSLIPKVSIYDDAPQLLEEKIDSVSSKDSKRKMQLQLGVEALAYLAVLILSVRFNSVFDRLFVVLKRNQLFLSQSLWKPVFIAFAFIVIFYLCADAWKQYRMNKSTIGCMNFVFIFFYTVLFCISYAAVYAYVHNTENILYKSSDIVESFILAGLYFGGVFVIITAGILIGGNKAERIASVSVLAVAAAMSVVLSLIGRTVGHRALIADDETVFLNSLQETTECNLYANELPLSFRQKIKSIRYTGACDEGFSVIDNAAVIMNFEKDIPDLFYNRYKAAKISNEHILCTNSESAIDYLGTNGYECFDYYPFEKSVDIRALADVNGLNYDEELGIEIKGEQGSLIVGPDSVVEPGNYLIQYKLSLCSDAYELGYQDDSIGRIRISCNYGNDIISELDVSVSDFDNERNFIIEVPMYIERASEGIRYQFFGAETGHLFIDSISVRRNQG